MKLAMLVSGKRSSRGGARSELSPGPALARPRRAAEQFAAGMTRSVGSGAQRVAGMGSVYESRGGYRCTYKLYVSVAQSFSTARGALQEMFHVSETSLSIVRVTCLFCQFGRVS